MAHHCPECSTEMHFNVENIELVLLRLKCNSCGKMLSMSGSNHGFVEAEDKKINIDRLKDMVKLAWSDGKVTAEEKAAIIERGHDLGVEESSISQIISDFAMNKIEQNCTKSHQLVKEYDEDLREYYNSEWEAYDINKFMEKIAALSADDPNIKKYREDSLKILDNNQEGWMDKARFWESIYNDSSLETEWKQAHENMQKCMELSDSLQALYDHVSSLKKKDFIKYAISFIEKGPDDWD